MYTKFHIEVNTFDTYKIQKYLHLYIYIFIRTLLIPTKLFCLFLYHMGYNTL